VTDEIQGPEKKQGFAEEACAGTVPLLEVMRHAEKVIARLRSRVARLPSLEAADPNETPPAQGHGRTKRRRTCRA
jgi:hypothetical protein